MAIYRQNEYAVGKYEEIFQNYLKNNATNDQKWCIISRHKTLTNAYIAIDKRIAEFNKQNKTF